MSRLKGKVAVISGASSGIGRATAIRFAQEGAALVLCARRSEKLSEVGKECESLGVKVVCVTADVVKPEDCSAVIKACSDTFGHLDILVNNAGIGDKHRPITECDNAWWEHVIATDQTSVFYLTKEALKIMEGQGRGSIVNVSSIGGVFGSAGISYSAAKSALLGMTKNIAIQYAPKCIRCNAVCPGPTPTELNTPEKLATFTTWFAKQCAEHMNMTLPESSDVDQANAILFFASDESVAVTGQVLIVDHGTTL